MTPLYSEGFELDVLGACTNAADLGRYPGVLPSPASRAMMIALARSAAWSLARMFETLFRTVFSERTSRRAIVASPAS
jgi:hypothetical protein